MNATDSAYGPAHPVLVALLGIAVMALISRFSSGAAIIYSLWLGWMVLRHLMWWDKCVDGAGRFVEDA